MTPTASADISTPKDLPVAVVILLTAPLAMSLEYLLPISMRAVSECAKSYVPWPWGIYSALPVIGSVLAVMCTMTFGFRAVVPISALFYLVAPLAGLGTRRRTSGERGRHDTWR